MIPRRGLYVADLSPSRGTEPGKLRPVLVVQADQLSEAGRPSTWVLTGDSVLRVRIDANAAGNPDACEVMIDQSRAIDNQRFQRELGDLPDSLLATVAARLRQVGDL